MSLNSKSSEGYYNKINLVFRFDDYLLESSVYNDSLLNVFRKNDIQICLGIIPFDEEGLINQKMELRKLQDFRSRIVRNEIEIAIHGYNHINNNLDDELLFLTPWESEFGSLDYNIQYSKIKRSKKTIDSLLETDTKIFIPPWNTYDNNTLTALDSLGFSILSAGFGVGPSNYVNIKYIPFTLQDLKEIPTLLRKYRNQRVTILIMIHSYSFQGWLDYPGFAFEKISFNELDTLLSWIKTHDYVQTTTFSSLNKSENFDNTRFNLNTVDRSLLKKLLYKMKLYRYGVYYPTESALKYHRIIRILNWVLHILIFLCVYIIITWINRLLKPSMGLIIAFLILVALAMIFIQYLYIRSYSLLIISVLFVTIYAALIAGIFKKNSFIKSEVFSDDQT
jgi:peptidoglycan/xylan/chitin deacetylase (PgdA/CDA1 family)